MKRMIKASKDSGYLYIMKHGLGPGTLPRDVRVLDAKDLPNYYTAAWVDRPLTSEELDYYDVPSETQIDVLLERVGMTQDDLK